MACDVPDWWGNVTPSEELRYRDTRGDRRRSDANPCDKGAYGTHTKATAAQSNQAKKLAPLMQALTIWAH